MPFTPFLALIAPVIGLLLLAILASTQRLRHATRYLVAAITGLMMLGVMGTLLEPRQATALSLWRPSDFFGALPVIEATPSTWPLATAITCAATAAALVQLSRRTEPRPLLITATLGMVFAALGSLWSANLLTLLIFWGCFDLAWTIGMLSIGASVRRIALAIGASLASTVLLYSAALTIRATGNSLSWHLTTLEGLTRELLIIAGVLRLGLYPLHVNLPLGASGRAAGAAPLLLGPVLGWGVLLRIAAASNGTLAAGAWLPTIGMVGLAAGGVLTWTRSSARDALPWAALTSAGATVWGATAAIGAAPTVLALGGSAWILGVTALHLGRGLDRSAPWWSIVPVLGGLTLLGAFPTLGRVSTAAVLHDLTASATAVKLLCFFVGQTLLTAGLARHALRPAHEIPRAHSLERFARAVGLTLPGLLLLAGGISPALLSPGGHTPGSAPGVVGWLMWGLASIAGGAMFAFTVRIRRQIEPLLGLVFDLTSLDWFLAVILGSLGRISTFFRAAAELIEGAGAVLWAFAILLLTILMMLGSQ